MRLQFLVSKKKSELVGEDSVAFWNLKTRSTEDFASGLGGTSNSEWSVRSSGRSILGFGKISLVVEALLVCRKFLFLSPKSRKSGRL